MDHADIVVAVLGVLAVASIADLLTGRRGFVAAGLVSSVGAACGWFLSVRVLAVTTMDDWAWICWALAGAVISSVAYSLFRSKR